ncbi:11816_t:CDS:2, partial [Funneliformis caledonium]
MQYFNGYIYAADAKKADKKIDASSENKKSFAAHYSLTIIQNNEDIANLLEFIYIAEVGRGGKTFCYVASSLIFSGLTVMISPLKALILDQVKELIKVGIPCAGLYITIWQSLEYQEKIFQEIASKMLKILLIMPEKLILNQ